jgi:hypothetical protein
MGGIEPLEVLEKTGMSSLPIRSCGQKGKFLLVLFFLKEKYAPFNEWNISF